MAAQTFHGKVCQICLHYEALCFYQRVTEKCYTDISLSLQALSPPRLELSGAAQHKAGRPPQGHKLCFNNQGGHFAGRRGGRHLIIGLLSVSVRGPAFSCNLLDILLFQWSTRFCEGNEEFETWFKTIINLSIELSA